MPRFTVYAKRRDIIRLEATVEAANSAEARNLAEKLNEDAFEFIDSDSLDWIEIDRVEEKGGDK